MNNQIRNATLGFSALLVLGLALAPSAQASDIGAPNVPELVDTAAKPVCPPYNPDAWVNCSVTVSSFTVPVNAYNVDPTPPTTQVCPLGTICVYVPVVYPNGVVYDYTYYFTLYNAHVSHSVHLDNVLADACEILGPTCVAVVDLLESTEISG
jgi:hypothetical protein